VQLENHFTVDAPIDEAWQVLLDVERVAHCMPGATLDSVEGDHFNGKVKVKVGPIVVTYQGVARFVERDEHAHRAVIDASGKESRGAGTAKATVTTSLHDDGGKTRVSVLTDLNITGRPAQFGRGVIADVASTLTDRFAQSLAMELGNGVGSPPATSTPDASTDGPQSGSATTAGTGPPASSPVDELGTDSESPAEDGPVPRTPVVRPERDDDVIDLLGVSAAPVLKRLVPVFAALGALAVGVILLRRRRRGD
jgi:carbon monoxide dehydrogenase subunit G